MSCGVRGTVRRKIFRRDQYTCVDCGLKGHPVKWPCGSVTHPTERKNIYLSIDHIIPRSRGGSNDESNLRTLCTSCNSLKGTKVLPA